MSTNLSAYVAHLPLSSLLSAYESWVLLANSSRAFLPNEATAEEWLTACRNEVIRRVREDEMGGPQ